jgi:hypothetical protein
MNKTLAQRDKREREIERLVFVDKQAQAEQMIGQVSVIWGGAGDGHARS